MIAEISKDEDSCEYYKFTLEDIKTTDISKWYKKFENSTMFSVVLPIPKTVVSQLQGSEERSDISGLPLIPIRSDIDDGDIANVQYFFDGPEETPVSSDELGNNEEEIPGMFLVHDFEVPSINWEPYALLARDRRRRRAAFLRSRPDPPPTVVSDIKEFDKTIDIHIKNLGGAVIPKINWASPLDARLPSSLRSLRCQSPADIKNLFSRSMKVKNVLKDGIDVFGIKVEEPHRKTYEYNLVLRKWIDTDSDMEFRCFVCDDRLTAICQRNINFGYNSISVQKDEIILDIHNFFCDNIHGRLQFSFYVFDVLRLSPGRVLLIDFGVFGLPTDPLLFSYREIRMIMEETNHNLQSKDAKSKSGLKDVFVFGEPYFRYLTEDYKAYKKSLWKTRITPDNLITYLRVETTP